MILALETAFSYCSVCVFADGNTLELVHKHLPRQQTQQILPMINTVLKTHQLGLSDISTIAFNRGPGSFSGVRINTAVAQALAFAHDIPCVPVSSLQAQAQAVFMADTSIDDVTIINDAKMKEVYFANFSKGKDEIAQLVATEKLLAYEHDFATEITTTTVTGDGVELITLPKHVQQLPIVTMTAEHIAILAYEQVKKENTVSAMHAQPVYLRNNAWKTLAEQRQHAQQKQ